MRSNIKDNCPIMHLPTTLVREYKLEYKHENGIFKEICHITENRQQLALIDVNKKATAIKLTPIKTWDSSGDKSIHLFSFDVK